MAAGDARRVMTGSSSTVACEVEWNLCFSDAAFEAAFRADAFRLVFVFHVGIFLAVILLFSFGLFDPTFKHISSWLMPVAVCELAIRVVLHYHHHFRSDPQLAQRLGARAMLLLTPVAWMAYIAAAHRMSDEPPASRFMSALLPITLVAYPSQLGLFMLSPRQRLLVALITVISGTSAAFCVTLVCFCLRRRARMMSVARSLACQSRARLVGRASRRSHP